MARIMIVDDILSIREIVTAILQKHGHRVYQAASGDQALGIAKDRRLHLIMTDLNMPAMDGITFIGKLRGLEHHEQTPVIVLARGAKDGNVERAKAAGADDWIVKPFNEDSLLFKINQVLVDHYVN